MKTNALFFIDSIASYRDADGWLKTTFERLLETRIDALLAETSNPALSPAYREFLEATKRNLALAHGGYFARDWGEPDESAAAEEREDILHKERTLPFRKSDGTWNIRRFFFSKWTLREGWDNPNVFTICKLRTSGSDTSKIQEVGRGLRLPVDEQGNRLAGFEWRLQYIIGWDERDFAEKLIGEINSDARIQLDTAKLTDAMIRVIVEARGLQTGELLRELDSKNIINRDNTFQEGGYEKLLAEYPELLQTQVRVGKVVSSAAKDRGAKVKLRKANWEKIADFWKKVSKRYLLSFERLEEGEIGELLESVLKTDGVFDLNRSVNLVIQETRKTADGGGLALTEKTVTIANPGLIGKLTYGEFVCRLAKRTAIPVAILHARLWKRLDDLAQNGLDKVALNARLNLNSLEKIVAVWEEQFAETYAAKYDYDPLNYTADTSIMKGGSFVNEIAAGLVGTTLAKHLADDPRNLYEPPRAYDSEMEREIETYIPNQQVIVFGKVPRRAIRVPTYTGGSTTPDFVYVIKEAQNRKHDVLMRESPGDSTAKPAKNKGRLALLIETKAANMRGTEKRSITAQEKLFRKIPGVKWRLLTSAKDIQAVLEDF